MSEPEDIEVVAEEIENSKPIRKYANKKGDLEAKRKQARANLAKGRETRLANLKAKRENKDKQYVIKPEEVSDSDSSSSSSSESSESDDIPDYVAKGKDKKKHKKEDKQKKEVKKEVKPVKKASSTPLSYDDRFNRLENVIEQMAGNMQKVNHKVKKVKAKVKGKGKAKAEPAKQETKAPAPAKKSSYTDPMDALRAMVVMK
jgi:hypothetical protein